MITAESLRTVLESFRPYHSNFQIDNYIVARSGGTPYGMFRQTVRELRARWQSLAELYIAREKALKKKSPRDAAQRAQHLVRVEELELQIRDTEREFRRFYAHAVKLKAHLGELTEERIEQLEAEHWMHKLKQQAALDLLTVGRVQRDTLELLMALDANTRAPLMRELATPEGRERIMAWAGSYEPEVDIDRGGPLPELEGGLRDALLALGST